MLPDKSEEVADVDKELREASSFRLKLPLFVIQVAHVNVVVDERHR